MTWLGFLNSEDIISQGNIYVIDIVDIVMDIMRCLCVEVKIHGFVKLKNILRKFIWM